MKEQFVTYDIALKLKELGFDDDCIGCFAYDCGDESFIFSHKFRQNSKLTQHFTAPLWQQAISFLKSKGVLVTECWDGWEYGKDGYDFDYTKTIEEAILKAIEICQKEKYNN